MPDLIQLALFIAFVVIGMMRLGGAGPVVRQRGFCGPTLTDPDGKTEG